jgi:hypothetical protein
MSMWVFDGGGGGVGMKRFGWENLERMKAEVKALAEVQAEEDRKIFEVLDVKLKGLLVIWDEVME